MPHIEIGKLTKIVTLDGRAYIGTLTGYAEVSQGEQVLEEVYVSGCGDLLTIKVTDVASFDQTTLAFSFTPPPA